MHKRVPAASVHSSMILTGFLVFASDWESGLTHLENLFGRGFLEAFEWNTWFWFLISTGDWDCGWVDIMLEIWPCGNVNTVIMMKPLLICPSYLLCTHAGWFRWDYSASKPRFVCCGWQFVLTSLVTPRLKTIRCTTIHSSQTHVSTEAHVCIGHISNQVQPLREKKTSN